MAMPTASLITYTDYAQAYADAIVLDGIDMGRPCCGVAHCTAELLRTQDRYCAQHWQLNHQCVIAGCVCQADKDYRTCAEPAHRSTEAWWRLHGKGMFTLRKRLQRAQVSHPEDAVEPNAPADEVIEVAVEDGGSETFTAYDNSPANVPQHDPVTANPQPTPRLSGEPSATPSPNDPNCPEKPAASNRSLRATFGRRRTHNEQLGTRPCGIICFRETFYGSETTPQVLVCLFPGPGRAHTDLCVLRTSYAQSSPCPARSLDFASTITVAGYTCTLRQAGRPFTSRWACLSTSSTGRLSTRNQMTHVPSIATPIAIQSSSRTTNHGSSTRPLLSKQTSGLALPRHHTGDARGVV